MSLQSKKIGDPISRKLSVAKYSKIDPYTLKTKSMFMGVIDSAESKMAIDKWLLIRENVPKSPKLLPEIETSVLIYQKHSSL